MARLSNSDAPITQNEVLSWFPDSKFGRPNTEACKALTKAIEKSRSMFKAMESDKSLASAKAPFYSATKAARSLQTHLKTLCDKAGKYADGGEIQNLKIALNEFLEAAPGHKIGRQPAEWVSSAVKWGPMIRACLAEPNRPPPSLSSPEGPVTAVLAEAIARVYGMKLRSKDIGRRLQRTAKLIH